MFISPFMFILIPDERRGSLDRVRVVVPAVRAATGSTDTSLAVTAVTNFGAFVDPLADKVLVLGGDDHPRSRRHVLVVPVAIIFVRELAMSLYRTFVGAKGISVPASKIAKLKTHHAAVRRLALRSRR